MLQILKKRTSQQEESSISKKHMKKGNHRKEKFKCSYCGKGFHPEHAYMKKNLDETTSLLERNHINLPKSFRRRDQQDHEPQHEKGHALMASTSKSKALLIDSRASNHMMDERDSFSSLNTIKSIPIHMGDDSTITSEGKGTVDLKNDYFLNVLYVPSLASNLLSVYQMTHMGVPQRVSFSLDDVEIIELAF